MKKILFILLLAFSASAFAQTGIGTTTPDASAQLEVSSTTKGLLPPRMTKTQRDAISSPATGLFIYQTDGTAGLFQYNGTAWAAVSTAPGTTTGDMLYWNGSVWVTVQPGSSGQVLTFSNGVPGWSNTVGWNNVHNPTTGEIWMDRNLGATQVATSSNDANAYGDLYQWGRAADGHQIRTSGTTATLATSDTPGHGDFITINSGDYDWRNPQNHNLWQGVNGTNNPCPSGYRLPTEAEWEAERTSWSSNDAAGAFDSPLKLPIAGNRYFSDGWIGDERYIGYYWSSTVDGADSRFLFVDPSNDYMVGSNAFMDGSYRAFGYSVRCLKD